MSLRRMLGGLGLQVDQETIVLLDKLVDELLRWNRSRNLTAITDRNEVLEKHLADSLTLLPLARQSRRLLDIGSGAGFPALPLKIACPELAVVAIDAVGKKVDFQRHIVRILKLAGYVALHGRVELLQEQQDYRAGFDLVTARALCSLSELVPLAEPLLAPGGCLVAMKGPEGRQEYADLCDQLLKDGWSLSLHKLHLPLSGAERCLIEMRR